MTANFGGTMDRRAQLVQGLREVEKLIAEDEVNLSRQRRLIALLTKGGRDVTDAKKLLGEFETIRQQHVILQTRILAELGD